MRPYLIFSGDCEQALTFYKLCFSGSITQLKHCSQGVEYAEFSAEGLSFLACDKSNADNTHDRPIAHLALQCNDLMEQQRLFLCLANHGKIKQPLVKRDWGARYAEVLDNYGVHWRLNCQLPF